MTEPQRISVSEATAMGVSGLCSAVQKSRVIQIERHGKPFGFILSPDYYEELETIREDLLDSLLVISRMATFDGQTISLDNLLEEFGESREELMKEVEEDLRDAGLK